MQFISANIYCSFIARISLTTLKAVTMKNNFYKGKMIAACKLDVNLGATVKLNSIIKVTFLGI